MRALFIADSDWSWVKIWLFNSAEEPEPEPEPEKDIFAGGSEVLFFICWKV